MPETAVIHDTFVLERSYPVTRERLFAALSEPAQKRRWFTQGENHEVEDFALDFRVGGQERFLYRFHPGTPLAGQTLGNESIFLAIVPNQRVVTANAMKLDGRTISASLVTVELLRREEETTLLLTHQAAYFEGADGPQMREAGWTKLLDQMGKALGDQDA